MLFEQVSIVDGVFPLLLALKMKGFHSKYTVASQEVLKVKENRFSCSSFRETLQVEDLFHLP